MPTMNITNAGLDLWRDGSKNANNIEITYFAVGNSTTAFSASQTTLGNEQFRKVVTSYTNGASHGEIIITCYIAPNDAVGLDIEEVGIFGGNGASATANSGVMIGRCLYTHNPKSNTESIQLTLDLTF